MSLSVVAFPWAPPRALEHSPAENQRNSMRPGRWRVWVWFYCFCRHCILEECLPLKQGALKSWADTCGQRVREQRVLAGCREAGQPRCSGVGAQACRLFPPEPSSKALNVEGHQPIICRRLGGAAGGVPLKLRGVGPRLRLGRCRSILRRKAHRPGWWSWAGSAGQVAGSLEGTQLLVSSRPAALARAGAATRLPRGWGEGALYCLLGGHTSFLQSTQGA